jgi:aspartate/methionine/tyrosine aminotransferase
VFPNIRGLGLGDAATVADRVLNEAGVAALAGTAFGPVGEGHLRLSYANSLENLNLAVERIGDWVRSGKTAVPAAGD